MSIWVMAVDVGTTNAKVEFFDERGRSRGDVERVRLPVARDGTASPVEIAVAVEDLIDRALGAAPRTPDAVAVTGAWHGLVGLDADGGPVGRLTSWLDTRAGEEAVLLRELVADPADLHDRTGARLHPSFPPARLLWLRRHEPESFRSTRRWCALPEYLEVRWFGLEAAPSLSLVSGSGLYDQRAGCYDPRLLELLALGSATLLPPVEGPPGTASTDASAPYPGRRGLPLVPAFARRWPALVEVPWIPALGDGAAALLSSAGRSASGGEQRASLTVGTSAAVRVLVPWSVRASRHLPQPLFAYLLDADRAVVGSARSNAGSLVAWAGRVLHLGEAGAGADLVELATRGRTPGSHRLTAQASLGGERSPEWPPEAYGGVSGLRYETTALDVIQALLEDSVLGLARSVRTLEEWSGPFRVVLSGGGGRSQGWRRLLADALGRPVTVSRVLEASARGAALAALEKLSWAAAEAWEPDDGEVVEPDRERAEAFARLL